VTTRQFFVKRWMAARELIVKKQPVRFARLRRFAHDIRPVATSPHQLELPLGVGGGRAPLGAPRRRRVSTSPHARTLLDGVSRSTGARQADIELHLRIGRTHKKK